MTLSTEEFIDSQPSSSLLVYFSGILGFTADARGFLPAKKFTSHLSALIYIQRLLFLEYALPLRPYPYLGMAFPGVRGSSSINISMLHGRDI
jgi:hypothetical protein